MLLLTLPGLVVIGLLLLLPVGWLFYLSFSGADGGFSLEHYTMLARPLYVATFKTTFQIAAIVTLAAAILGYPTAYMLSVVSGRWATIGLAFVLLPFWTSVLVRTYAWLALLQRRGLVNDWLMDLGLIDAPLALVHNFTGATIGMVHIMLPFMIFPIYTSLKAIDEDLWRAASSCGAPPLTTFWKVVFPLTLPGLFVGAVLVFVLSIGYYTTPILLGGGRVNMIAIQIETNLSRTGDWGAASSLGAVLVVVTVVILAAFSRVVRPGKYLERP